MAEVLARAFYDDPPMSWILPHDASRARRLSRMFATILRYEALPAGVVDVAVSAERVVGVAIWFSPDAWRPAPLLQQLRSLPSYLRALGRRLGPASNLMAAAVRAHPAEPHWYLAYIGVDPAAQGHGAGSALLRSRLAQLDAQSQASFLESSKPGNIPLYEHFGYVVSGEPHAPDGCPLITPMWRGASV